MAISRFIGDMDEGQYREWLTSRPKPITAKPAPTSPIPTYSGPGGINPQASAPPAEGGHTAAPPPLSAGPGAPLGPGAMQLPASSLNPTPAPGPRPVAPSSGSPKVNDVAGIGGAPSQVFTKNTPISTELNNQDKSLINAQGPSSGMGYNYSRYLALNRDNAAPMARTLADGFAKQGQGAQGAIDKAFNRGMSTISPTWGKGGLYDASSYFKKGGAGYVDPDSMADSLEGAAGDDFKAARNSIDDLDRQVALTRSSDGRKQLLSQAFGRPDYSQGQQGLDSLLLGATPAGMDTLRQAESFAGPGMRARLSGADQAYRDQRGALKAAIEAANPAPPAPVAPPAPLPTLEKPPGTSGTIVPTPTWSPPNPLNTGPRVNWGNKK